MEVDDSSKPGLLSLLLLIAALCAIAGGLSVQTFMTARAISSIEDPDVEALLARLAWLSMVLLALTLVLLFWGVARLFRWGFGSHGRAVRTPYVDAWSLAGQRMKAPEETEEEDDGTDDRDDGDRNNPR